MRLYRLMMSIALLWTVYQVNSQNDNSSDLSLDERLLIAADQGDTSAALQLIEQGANVNTTTYDGVTPLMYAAQYGDTSMIQILMVHGADVNLKPANGHTAIISAIRNGYLQTVEYLIRNGADINLADGDGVTPLMHAIAVDSFYMSDMLMYYDAAVDRKNKQGVDALMLASWLGRYESVIALLERGADINSFDEHQWMPLHYATLAGRTDIMDLLIVNGASLESVTSSGYTPLALATVINNYPAARLLIGYGADVNTRISSSLNPLTLALENKNDSLVRMLENQNARTIRRPNFNHFTFGTSILMNDDDTHLGFTFGLSDKKYNLMMGMGYGFRLKAIQVLEQTNETEFYQYWERRHFISLYIEKGFYWPDNIAFFRTGIFGGIGEAITFGDYRGASSDPDVRLVLNPRIGGIIEYKFIRIKMDYEIMNLHLRDVSRNWFNFTIEFLFNRNRGRLQVPSMKWF